MAIKKTFSAEHPEDFITCSQCEQPIFDEDEYFLIVHGGTGERFPCCSEECSDEKHAEMGG